MPRGAVGALLVVLDEGACGGLVKCDRPELFRRGIRRHAQAVALRTIEGMPLRVAEASEVSLPSSGGIAAHTCGDHHGIVCISGTLIELAVVRQVLVGSIAMRGFIQSVLR